MEGRGAYLQRLVLALGLELSNGLVVILRTDISSRAYTRGGILPPASSYDCDRVLLSAAEGRAKTIVRFGRFNQHAWAI